VGKGAKASHLTYLGDAEVGEGTNIGAGVITCNYDGVHKHRTHIGKASFVGSDSTLSLPSTSATERTSAQALALPKTCPPALSPSAGAGKPHRRLGRGQESQPREEGLARTDPKVVRASGAYRTTPNMYQTILDHRIYHMFLA